MWLQGICVYIELWVCVCVCESGINKKERKKIGGISRRYLRCKSSRLKLHCRLRRSRIYIRWGRKEWEAWKDRHQNVKRVSSSPVVRQVAPLARRSHGRSTLYYIIRSQCEIETRRRRSSWALAASSKVYTRSFASPAKPETRPSNKTEKKLGKERGARRRKPWHSMCAPAAGCVLTIYPLYIFHRVYLSKDQTQHEQFIYNLMFSSIQP